MVRWEPIARIAGEFAAFLAILVGGATLVGWADGRFMGSTGVAVTLLLFAATAAAALGVVWLTSPESGMTPGSAFAGVGGALGFLAAEFLVGGPPAVGAALGAGLGALVGFGAERAGPFARGA